MTIKNVALFVTGGIAAYKVPLIVRGLIKAGYDVRVAMTTQAKRFVTPETLAILSKHAVLSDGNEFEVPEHVAHVELAHWADLMIVAPATANTIAKMAHGIADNVVTTTLLATTAPVLLVPAMNDQMFQAPATQANLSLLMQRGVTVLPPDVGFLAEGYAGKGRMPDPEKIVLGADFFSDPFLTGKQVLVTAGGTKERIDPVRYITNDSSGQMGTDIANAAAAAGADVTLITTKDRLVLPHVSVIKVESASEMADAVAKAFPQVDVLVMAAAVGDFRPTQANNTKIKKDPQHPGLQLQLRENPDILATAAAAKGHQFVVGFAAETNDVLAHAQAKLVRKHVDLLVANQVGHDQGFDRPVNTVTLLRPGREAENWPELSKITIAKRLVALIATELDTKE